MKKVAIKKNVCYTVLKANDITYETKKGVSYGCKLRVI